MEYTKAARWELSLGDCAGCHSRFVTCDCFARCAAERGADSAAGCPYQIKALPPGVAIRHRMRFNPFMPTKDPRIDAYIAKSADFARPVLDHLRKLVHTACPEVEETMKWNFPHFLHQGILCGMGAFKEHCTFGFWKRELVLGKDLGARREDSMGQFGRITALADLPSDKLLLGYIRKAAVLNEAGVKSPARKPKAKKPLAVPADFKAALTKNKTALATFENFSPSHKREYLEWITGAKRAETRNSRLTTAIAWLAEGKSRHWKYANC